MDHQRIPRQALHWEVPGFKRGPGRLRTNWRSTVNKNLLKMGITWEEVEVTVQNRSEWCRSVAQYIHLDAGWIKVKVKVKLAHCYWVSLQANKFGEVLDIFINRQPLLSLRGGTTYVETSCNHCNIEYSCNLCGDGCSGCSSPDTHFILHNLCCSCRCNSLRRSVATAKYCITIVPCGWRQFYCLPPNSWTIIQ